MSLIWLILLLALGGCAQDGVVAIDNWRVRDGDDARWSKPDFDDSEWEAVGPPRRTGPWLSGISWYRATIAISSSRTGQAAAVGICPLDEVYEVFVEGVLIGRFGRWNPNPVGFFERHLSFPIPPGLASEGMTHIAIRRWKGGSTVRLRPYSLRGLMLENYAPRVGPAALISAQEKLHAADAAIRSLSAPLAHLLTLIVGIVSLGLFTMRKSRVEYLWLGLALFFLSIGPLVGIVVTAQDGLSRRSLLPSLLPIYVMLSNACSSLLLAVLCPRLKWVLRGHASFELLCGVALLVSVWAQWGPGSMAIPISTWATLAVQTMAAGVLLTDRRDLVTVSDVSGKGLEAAMVVTALVGTLRGSGMRCPGEVLTQLNRSLAMTARAGFVTCLCALIHPDGHVDISNAGHLAPYANGREIELAGALPLGVDPQASYSASRINLRDASLVLVSDGVVEAANDKGELFGFERTRVASAKSASEIAAAAEKWGQNDDITVLTIRSAA